MKTLTHQTRRFDSRADIPKTYRELCELCLPRPIHDDAQDEEATAMMLALAGFTRLNPEQQDYLDVLTEFVDEYDQGKKIRWPKISGLDSLKCLLEENGISLRHFQQNLGMPGGNFQQHLGRTRRLTAALLPVLQRVGADAQNICEF
jgi:hypothetical protein